MDEMARRERSAGATEIRGGRRVALLGNPNAGKTTLFNRLCGLRHKTSNFPGTTQEARVGHLPQGGATLIDLPGIYSLELDQGESEMCRRVLAGDVAVAGAGAPDAAVIVLDATNLSRHLMLAGEVLRRRLPTLVVVNMIDLARRRGLRIDTQRLGERLGCEVVCVSARAGEGLGAIPGAIERAAIPNRTPPGSQEELESWADESALLAASRSDGRELSWRWTDRLDRVLTHPASGSLVFAGVMLLLFWAIFALAQHPMDWIDAIFASAGGWIERAMPEGLIAEFASRGVLAGVGATLVFLPQICLLFFLISLLEDTGYLARGAFVVDRLLRPFGLRGHSFVPLLSSHACAIPGIIACRGVPDTRERLATILVAPFMTCSARLPVYALMTGILFRGESGKAALAFVGCYALGMFAGAGSALLARRTILRGPSRAMAMELPAFRRPGVRNALVVAWDRALVFVKQAGTNILAISIVLWWLGSYPKVEPPASVAAMRTSAHASQPADAALLARADEVEAADARARSFIGRLGRAAQPVFEPLGYDWQLTVGVLSSFAAREVFVATMAVVTTGHEDGEDESIRERVGNAKRDDGVTPVFTRKTAWSVLVFYVLAMQCLPTLAVTARESGSAKWAAIQFGWMSALAYAGAWLAYTLTG